jgi:proteasome lid subunit RPN8/RPN11
MLELPRTVRDIVVAHCVRSLPLEGCGLLLGDPERNVVLDACATRNAADSALVYQVDAADQLRVDREARSRGLEVIGAFHSHTHTDAWPSPTDVGLAVDASWHWVIVSLRHFDPVLRSFRITAGTITPEPVSIA